MAAGAAVVLLIAAGAAIAPRLRHFAERAWLTFVVQRARVIAQKQGRSRARLSEVRDGAAGTIAGLLPAAAPLGVASRLEQLASVSQGDEGVRARGIAFFVSGDFDQASRQFALVRSRDATDWNDLAAAESAAAQQERSEERWLKALAAVDRALALDPQLEAANFNRALIVHSLGALPVARDLWAAYLRHDPGSAWGAAARRHLASIQPGEAEIWGALRQRSEPLAEAELLRMARLSPEHARRYGEGWFPALWADAMSRGEVSLARQQLDTARLLAGYVRSHRGESLAAEAVAAIESARGSAVEQLTAAYLAYSTGRQAHGVQRYDEAAREYGRARQAFLDAGSPMVAVAEFYAACVLFDRDQPAAALRELEALLARERKDAPDRHRALIAQIQYQISLCEAARGHWSASLAAAQEAFNIFTAIGERGNAGAAQAVLSEDYDFIGQPDLSWKHGVAALRVSSRAGDLVRARTIVAVLCRTEMRGRRWERALALSTLEGDFARIVSEPRLNADLFLRQAVILSRLGRAADAGRAVAEARRAAGVLPDAMLRTKLLADIDGAAGAIVRSTDPHAAVRLLSSAIAFQRKASRPILLSELHLERGRAFRSLGDLQAAGRDFEEGIAELERQRTMLHDAQLRGGIFDDASDLFAEAVSLQLQRKTSVEAVLAYVERGRARTLLEQLGEGRQQEGAGLPRIVDIQRELVPGSVIIEYVALPDRLLTILISPDRVVLRTALVSRAEVAALTDSFIEELSKGESARGSALFDILIRPLAGELRGVTAINVVADDILQRIPFTALYDRDARVFLVGRYAIGMVPSAGVFIATSGRVVPAGSPRPSTAIVFGNPRLPRDLFPSLRELSGAEREARWVGSRYPRGEVFTGETATAHQFLTVAPDREVVHFAGHALLSRTEPGLSALVLAAGKGRGGTLTVAEISAMRFRSTRLVVLAACSTMTGRKAAVEGMPTIARAFLVAGVPAVVGTLWDIDDREAAPLMRTFHEEFARGSSPGEALRAAQIRAIRAGVKPSIWSAFALTGTSRPATVARH